MHVPTRSTTSVQHATTQQEADDGAGDQHKSVEHHRGGKKNVWIAVLVVAFRSWYNWMLRYLYYDRVERSVCFLISNYVRAVDD